MAPAEGIGVGGLAGRPDVEATALGAEVEFLAGRLVFGADAVGNYADDACSGFDSSSHQCLFRFAYESGCTGALPPNLREKKAPIRSGA